MNKIPSLSQGLHAVSQETRQDIPSGLSDKDQIRYEYGRERDMSKVTYYPARKDVTLFDPRQRSRVVVYCRVSTDGIRSGKDIKIVIIDWFWKPFIPIGRLTMIRSRQPQTALNLLSAISGLLSSGIKLPTLWNGQIFDTTPMEPIHVGIMTEHCCPRKAKTFFEANHGNSHRIVWIDHLENCDMETTIVKEKLGLLIIDAKGISFENAIEGNAAETDRLERYYKRLYYTAKKTNCAIIVIDEISRIPYVSTNDYYCMSSLRNIIEIRGLKAGHLSFRTVKNNYLDSCYDPIMIRFDDELRLILETGSVDTRTWYWRNKLCH